MITQNLFSAFQFLIDSHSFYLIFQILKEEKAPLAHLCARPGPTTRCTGVTLGARGGQEAGLCTCLDAVDHRSGPGTQSCENHPGFEALRSCCRPALWSWQLGIHSYSLCKDPVSGLQILPV